MKKCRLNSRQLEELYALEVSSYNQDEAYSPQFIEELNNEESINILTECRNNQLIGFVIYQKEKDRVHIIDIIVMGKYRRCMVGYGLLRKVEEAVQSLQIEYYAEVRESNIASIKCFEKAGYEKKRIIKGYYENPIENAIVMMK